MSSQKIIIGNSLDELKKIDDNTIDLCVTSPPYWQLRDYGSKPVIWGGNINCLHEWSDNVQKPRGGAGKNCNVGCNKDAAANNRCHDTITRYCSKCGAWMGQLGLEPTPDEYIKHLSMIFNEIHRIIKPDGACWVNIGDTYNKEKSLCQIPSLFSIMMVKQGWILRNECIWHKPNTIPVSVKDRFTIDFEKFFFFTKNKNYYFKQQLEPVDKKSLIRSKSKFESNKFNMGVNGSSGISLKKMGSRFVNPKGRNQRTTWSIPVSNEHIDHCAMYPLKLVEIPINSCCPVGGTVIDPFCGSGTTLEYCFSNNINAIGIEINPEFKTIIEKRCKKNQTRLELI